MTFGALFSQVTGLFDKRFMVTYFLPSLIFWALLIIVWFAGRGQLPLAAGLWETGQGVGWVVRSVGFFVWLVIFANLLASQSMALLRLYEGYWNFPGAGPFRRLGQKWHQKKLANLEILAGKDPKNYQYIYFGYPLPTQPDQVMPTQLGNILKNSELYPHDRYKIDAVLVWPRLYNLFPAAFAQAVVEMRTGLDFMLVISFLAVAFAFVSGFYLIVVGASASLFLLCFVGGLVSAWIAYRGALGNAVLYAQQIKVAFDLYRDDLLKQMRVPLPKSPAAERLTWEALNQFLYRGIPPELAYTGADGSAKSLVAPDVMAMAVEAAVTATIKASKTPGP